MRVAALLGFLLPAVVFAHQPSDSFVRLDASAATVRGQWDVALRDLEVLVGLDADGDRHIRWGELERRRSVIEDYLRPHLQMRSGGRTCWPVFDELLVDEHAGNGYAALRFVTDCPGRIAISVRYTLLFDLDPQHRGLLRLEYPDSTPVSVFAPDTHEQRFQPKEPAAGTAFLAFMGAGVIHIWQGIDHILFLMCLLLPAVLCRRGGRWRPATGFGPAFWATVRVVTAFTVAHSLTLALAAFEIVSLPARLVESAIAASIVVAALNNLLPVVRHHLWSVAFVFGLLHGFGFANVVRDLGIDGSAFAVSLLGFNAGVEIGQLCIVAVWLPASHALRTLPVYRPVVLQAGSVAIAAMAAGWLLQRVAG